jgi:hypothetical protein
MNRSVLQVSLLATVLSTPLVSQGARLDPYSVPEQEVYKLYRGKKSPVVLMPQSSPDRAVGILDKGELSTVTSNFGLLSEYHFFAPAMHWPATATDLQQSCFGLGFFVARQDNVVESFSNPTYKDWQPKDGSYGGLFSGNKTTSDGTPLMASSDDEETWPRDAFGDRFWPGPYRRNPETGQPDSGRFTSDRDLFCIFDDKYNQKPPLGLDVHQSSYAYGRPYAQDFLIFDFQILNTGPDTLRDLYAGYSAAFRVDYDFMDYLNFVDTQDPDMLRDFVYVWDINGQPQDPWQSVFSIGTCILHTPRDMGITDFHYFKAIHKPITDEEMWPIIASLPSDPDVPDSANYFHGQNVRLDDPDWMRATPPDTSMRWNYFISTGPFDLAPGDSVHSALAVVAGADSADILDNVSWAQRMSERYYVGSDAPLPPVVQATAGDRRVTLYWDPEPSEGSRDALTDLSDFEGYKVYRSDDRGESWGVPITDTQGEIVGYVPVALFDKKDGILGPDPAYPQSLGADSGLRHQYVDTTVVNGKEYWYCVTAFDRGNQNPDSLEMSYESPKGRPGSVRNAVAIIPAVTAAGWVPGGVSGDTLHPEGGIPCEGLAMVSVLDPQSITGHVYEVTFNDSLFVDTLWTDSTTFNLVDVSLSPPDTLLAFHPVSDSSLDNIPVTEGFRLTLLDAPSGIKTRRWTRVLGDTCTFDWWTAKKEGSPFYVTDAYLSGYEDFRIQVTDTQGGTWVWADGAFDTSLAYIKIPIKVFNVTGDGNPQDVSRFTRLADYRYDWDDPAFFGPAGWDLIPGGAGYNPNDPFGDWFPDEIGMWDSLGNVIYLRTQNGPATAIPPSVGDEYTVTTYKPFGGRVRYRIETTASHLDPAQATLDQVRVVPNPYIVSSAWETSSQERRLQFNHLPPVCTIRIFTLAGEEVIRLNHNDNLGYVFWNMRSKSDQDIAYGLYIYVIETPQGKTKTGRFLVIK